jgi:mannose-1-phosphate guanylyltransferase/phosphomannomutase
MIPISGVYKEMKAVVMAGGEGTRLRPLTSNRPKPLVPVCNKPVMQYIIELLKRHGVKSVVNTLYYLADEIVSFFGDGSDFGMHCIYSVEDEPLGTAGSVKKVEHYLKETFIIISGDSLTDFDLSAAVNFHREKGSMATIVLTRVENPLEYGVVITEEDGKIRRFLEKPSWGEVFSDTINTGIYILEPEIFGYMEPGKVYDFSKDLFPQLLKDEQPLYGYIAGGYWCDIGNLQAYRQAHYDMLSGRVNHQIPGVEVSRGIWIGEGSEINPRAVIRAPAVIGRNCRVKESCLLDEYSVLGDSCILEEGAALNRAIIWPNVYVGKKSRLTGCTVSRQNTIKSYVVLSEGVVLGEKCFIGQGAIIHPQVKVWPDKSVEAGANVSMSLIWGAKWPGALFGVDGIEGVANIEITPEFAMKLGAAYGAYHEKKAVVITGRDSHPASRMINRSIICGLTSVGVDTQDMRVVPVPVCRYTVRNSGARGGIFARISPNDPAQILLEFYDGRGVNIDKSTERKIENIFFREDFRRTAMDEVGSIEFPGRAMDAYMDGFFNNITADLVARSGYKVIIDYGYGNASMVLPQLLGKLGCETVAINAYMDVFKARDYQTEQAKALAQLSNIVVTLNANLGILIDWDAERMVLVDEAGEIVSGNLLLLVLAQMAMRGAKEPVIAVPVSAPSAIEKLAEAHRGKVIRTKTDGRSLMHTAALGEKKIRFAGHENGGFIFPHFQPAFDAMFTFAKTMEMMASENVPLSRQVSEIPPFYISRSQMECAWQQKGKVMRRLIEESKNRPVEMTEGIKVFFEDSWVLVIPDPAEPTLHLVAEGSSQEMAERIISDYQRKIENFKGGGSLMAARMAHKNAASQVKSSPGKSRREAKNTAGKETEEFLPDDRAFYFWTGDHFLGIKANRLKEFIDILHYVEPASLEFHMSRDDFANWLEGEVGNRKLGEELKKVKKLNLAGEELRKELLRIMK